MLLLTYLPTYLLFLASLPSFAPKLSIWKNVLLIARLFMVLLMQFNLFKKNFRINRLQHYYRFVKRQNKERERERKGATRECDKPCRLGLAKTEGHHQAQKVRFLFLQYCAFPFFFLKKKADISIRATIMAECDWLS